MEKRVTFNERWLPYLLVAPQIVITLVFFFWPSGQAIASADVLVLASDGSLQGFDVDFAKAMCVKLNADCEIIKQDWDGMIPGLIAKKYDVIVASMGILPEREVVVENDGRRVAGLW